MHKIMTRDGSVTFHSGEFDECYHSTTVGALEEAEEKYVKPANLQEGATVLDFCFGLGYNSLMALSAVNSIRIVACENDRRILEEIKNIDMPQKHKKNYKKIQEAADSHYYFDDDVTIKLFVGDAQSVLPCLKEEFDAVFFDPFSPKKCPELWSDEIFEAIYKLMKKGGILTTYSCARGVRDSLERVGFSVIDGPILGRKSPATIAIKG